MSKKRSSGGLSGVSNKRPQTPKFRLMPKLRQLQRNFPDLLYQFVHSWNLVKLVIAIDAIVSLLVVKGVNYTEIDWSTYMVQVKQVFNSTNFNFNYTQIEGPTGPLVYPAGHLYVFYLLKELTDGGTNIQAAQYIFLCIYIAQLILVYKIYSHKRVLKVPPYVFAIMCLSSYRIHSIYLLRLFNDPIAVLFAYASFYAMLRKHHALSAFLLSFAISIKMNILLFVPAYALVFYEDLGIYKSIKHALVALTTQIILAGPFLYSNPIGYLKRAFDFNRVFLHKWTVNWRFLDEETFISPEFFKILLIAHVVVLFVMFWSRWLNIIFMKKFTISARRDDPILTLFIANLIGIAFSRSLHYQFYVWYYHSLPLLIWATRYNTLAKMLILGTTEFAWNVYPSTTLSSLLLHASHIATLGGLFLRQFKTPSSAITSNAKSTGKKRRRLGVKK